MAKILTDAAIKRLQTRDRKYKVSDCLGLYLLVNPNDGRYWRWKYRFNGSQKEMAFGVYPDISLARARDMRDEYRKILASGVDPSVKKKNEQAAVINTFSALAEELHQKKIREGKSKRTLEKFLWVKKLSSLISERNR